MTEKGGKLPPDFKMDEQRQNKPGQADVAYFVSERLSGIHKQKHSD
jgi:hypothetical protein